MATMIDITGQRFTRLVVLKRAGNTPSGLTRWLCRCSCGRTTTAAGSALRSGNTKSCGCLQRDAVVGRNSRHGDALNGTQRSSLYSRYRSMMGRCINPNDAAWDKYGGRGITVCDRWRNSYEAFRDDMGYPPPGMSLDRIDNDGNYEPGNCRWASRKEQNQNTSRNHWIKYGGRQLVLSDWCSLIRMDVSTVKHHLSRGRDMGDIIIRARLNEIRKHVKSETGVALRRFQ